MTSQGIQKSKTGCITCRIRKVKCDEQKPFCKRCISTGRTCDGYRSHFRVSTAPGFSPVTVTTTTAALITVANPTSLPLSIYPPSGVGISFPSPSQIQYLAAHFTIKPTASMGAGPNANGINYELEARATLSATSEPAIHHALTSIATLRKVFEQATHPSSCCIRANSPEVAHGLSEYTHALRTLCVRISSNTASATRYSLLCCQMFITIELALDDFASATQHFIRGLRIMYQSVSRPYLRDTVDGGMQVMPAQLADLPSVDLFVLKLFMTPCPDGLTNDFLAEADGRFPPQLNEQYVNGFAIQQSNFRLVAIVRDTVRLIHGVLRLSPSNPSPNLVNNRRAILEDIQDWKQDFAVISSTEGYQTSPWIRLGLSFSMFCCLSTQVIATLATRPPRSESQAVERTFEELLATAEELSAIKREINFRGEYLTTFQVPSIN
ncbi:hypothetical protein DM02DRAFT_654231 [Periconia macrospinosa]|uniref:Zn(2)-C6 fungal-type domain-containing protein n=1 Tax=Periconia macrospinosa TaxID=97972 RepID=A0A2V1DTW6_9PLEO|nr:hypothetical protein DM02DRAFT_654231 [Periconia macrospinosa]